MTRPIKVAHLTSAHPRDDVRIFRKMCVSLAKAGYETVLIVADGKGDDRVSGVTIIDVGAFRGRLDRILRAPRRVLQAAKRSGARLFHLHDPELLPLTWELKSYGSVIFDSHEDVPKQMIGKPYLNPVLLRLLAWSVYAFEVVACRWLDAVIAATPSIRAKFERLSRRVIDINNFPMEGELETVSQQNERKLEICYVGAIAEIRGVKELCEALGQVKAPVRLNLVGDLPPASDLYRTLSSTAGWSRVNVLGYLDRTSVREVMGRSFAGIVTFHPLPNHVDAQPNKMFEYMSAGIPVIASDFPLWRQIIDGAGCGLLVDPLNPSSIATAIDKLAGEPRLVTSMGGAGRIAVSSRYNWRSEEKRLLSFYQQLVPSN